MKRLLIALLASVSALAQVREHSSLMHDCLRGANGCVRLSSTDIREANAGLKAAGDRPVGTDEARTNRAVNAIVFTTRLVQVESEILEPFAKVHQRKPYPQEVLAAWLVGVPKFKRLGYEPSRITDSEAKRLVDKYVYEDRIARLQTLVPKVQPPSPAEAAPQAKRAQPPGGVP